MEANYLFVDGSALTAQIRHLWRTVPSLLGRRLCVASFLRHFMVENHRDLHGASYKRATFYFPSGDDEAVERHLIVPDFRSPGSIRDLSIKHCGQKLKKSAKFDEFVQASVPPEFHNRFAKSEKGIDIEICCDAFKLAAAGNIERLFLLTNDDDFIPFFRTIKEYGANISLFHLTHSITPNVSLLREADSYDTVPDEKLSSMFLPIPDLVISGSEISQQLNDTSTLKPITDPSDLDEADQELEPMPDNYKTTDKKGK